MAEVTTTFSELLAAARAGRPEAVARLCDAYGDRLRGLVRRRLCGALRQKLDSTDVVQSVFAEMLRDLPRVADRGEVAFRHWLYLKAENKVRSKRRKLLGPGGRRWEGSLEGATPLPSSGPTPRTRAAEREQEASLRRLTLGLDRECRELMRMRLELALPFADIAQRLRLPSADAARKRYARALAELRRGFAARAGQAR